VLAGQIRRGSSESMPPCSGRPTCAASRKCRSSAGEHLIGILDDLFDLQAKAIVGHGGEILKFVGDGLLAIFPVANPDEAPAAAGMRSRRRKRRWRHLESCRRGRPWRRTAARNRHRLHYGTVIYGNVGAATASTSR